MASLPPSRCCTIGALHEGKPMGEVKNIANIPTYLSYPENKQTANAILILSDIIGYEFVNTRLIADQFAANGYFVVMPDLFEGDPVPLNHGADFPIREWLTTGGPSQGHTTKQVDPIVEAIIREMRESMGVRKIGSVGYCFGAKYVARFMARARAASSKGIIDVGAMAHPTFVDADELKAITGPLVIAAAETDPVFPAEKRRESEDILKDMDVPYQITLYSDVAHGFATRADLSNKRAKFAKEAAFLLLVQWFGEFIKGESAAY